MTMLVVSLVAGAALFGVVAATSSASFLTERAGLQDYDVQRFGTQASGLEIAATHPLGIGPGQFEAVSELSAHSTYVRALAEEGMVGRAARSSRSLLLTLGFAARNVVVGVDTYGIGSAALMAAWCGLLVNSFFVDTSALAPPLARRGVDLGRDGAPRRLPGQVGVSRALANRRSRGRADSISRRVEQLAQGERGLRRVPVRPADDQHAVDPLRQHLAVDETEERRPVEQDVVVLRFLDLARRSRRARRSRAAGPDRAASGRWPARAGFPEPVRAALSWKMLRSRRFSPPRGPRKGRESAPRRRARGAWASACRRRRATSCASPARGRARAPP